MGKQRRMKLLVPACQLNTAEIMGFLLGCSILTSLNHIFLFTDKSWRVLLSKSFSRSPYKLLWWGGNSSIFNDGEGRLTQRMPCCCACTLGCLALFGPNKLTAYSKELVWWVAFFFLSFLLIRNWKLLFTGMMWSLSVTWSPAFFKVAISAGTSRE